MSESNTTIIENRVCATLGRNSEYFVERFFSKFQRKANPNKSVGNTVFQMFLPDLVALPTDRVKFLIPALFSFFRESRLQIVAKVIYISSEPGDRKYVARLKSSYPKKVKAGSFGPTLVIVLFDIDSSITRD